MTECIYKNYFSNHEISLYDCGNRLKRRIINELYMASGSQKEGARVLDIGSGTGDIAYDLINNCQLLPQNYIIFDISQNTLDLCKIFLDNQNMKLNYIQGDAEHLPFKENAFDIVVCSEVIEHLGDDRLAMREVYRTSKNRGCFIVTTPYLGTPIKEYGHLRHYSKDSFSELSKDSGFYIKEIRYIGRFHNITWRYMKFLFKAIYKVYKISFHKSGYYEASKFHRSLIMPVFDLFLKLDYAFSREPESLIGDSATIVAFLQKP